MLDDKCLSLTRENPNLLIPWFITACVTYEEGNPILSDSTFDEISKEMIEKWDTLTHPDKKWIKIGSLNKGSSMMLQVKLK